MPKVTWKNVYEDFKNRHPRLAKKVMHWEPHSYATILLVLPGLERKLYNYDDHTLTNVPKKR